MTIGKVLLLLIWIGWCTGPGMMLSAGASKEMKVSFLGNGGGPKIDGKLDEGLYQKMQPSDGFFQYHPNNGEKPTFKTEVYGFYDKKNIYFAFKCYDSEPGEITADITPFGEYENNDEIRVYIDTFLDHRTYKMFSVNPRGVKAGEETVWDAAAGITDYGWCAEFKIPFKSLRFPVKDMQQWAINFRRDVFRLNEINYWTNVDRDRVLVGDFGETFGALEGVEKVRGGKNVEIFPYAGYRHSVAGETTDNKFAYGMDFKYGITSNLTLDLTTSPDYSEVESDPFFYQLSPFEYNLQERRPFYTEGSSYFDTNFSLFYSRRIDNPTFAAKVTGKEKGYAVGALFAQNDAGDVNRYHGVFRLKKDIFKLSTVGLIYTSAEEKGQWNRNLGFDFFFKIKNIYKITGMAAFSYNKDAPKKDNGMYYLLAGRQVDNGVTYWLIYERVEPNVSVPAGYVPKVDYQNYYLVGKYSFRWENSWIERLHLRLFYNHENSIREKQTTSDTMEFRFDFTTSNRIFLQAAFTAGKLRPKIFDDNRNLIWGPRMYDTRNVVVTAYYEGNNFFQPGLSATIARDYVYNDDFSETKKGDLRDITVYSNFKISPQVQLRIDYTNTYYKSLDNTITFKGDLIASSLSYQLTRKISSFVKFQYDSERDRFLYDFLVGYEPANVSKLYFSIKNYSEGRLKLFSPDVSSMAFKISYLIRI